MENEARPPVTDSPWFWVLTFSLMALAALVAIGGKYGRRQTRLELQYQARERIADRLGDENSPSSKEHAKQDRRHFASPGNNLIPLWPLAVVLLLIATFSAAMLYRGRRLLGSPGGVRSSP